LGYYSSRSFPIQVPGKAGGPPEKKEVLLEEHDPVWLELRHAHIAFVCIVPMHLLDFKHPPGECSNPWFPY
jgi:hypothetical protein